MPGVDSMSHHGFVDGWRWPGDNRNQPLTETLNQLCVLACELRQRLIAHGDHLTSRFQG